MNLDDLERLFTFTRLVRTQNSEEFIILNHKENWLAILDLHYLKCIYGTLIILSDDVNDNALDHLKSYIEERILSGVELREDFILTVYSGEEIAYISDTVEESPLDPVQRRDLDSISENINKILGRHQTTKSQLSEFIVCEYFKGLGYQTEKANEKLDSIKVDVIASDENETIYCQVKLGSINDKEMEAIVRSISKIKINKKKTVAIIANLFPNNYEKIRRELSNNYKTEIWLINKIQITETLRRYNKSI